MSGARPVLAEDLQRARAGWSAPLRRAAVVDAVGPAQADEPSAAGSDPEARWSTDPAGSGWVWEAGGVEVLDAAGHSTGVRWWEGDPPAAALRAALAHAPTWFTPRPPEDAAWYDRWTSSEVR